MGQKEDHKNGSGDNFALGRLYYSDMVQFTSIINKFNDHGEKTGWSYIEISAEIAQQLNPGKKSTYRVQGTIDGKPFDQLAMIPMGNGNFIIALNAGIRKIIGKRKGDKVKVHMELDVRPVAYNPEFLECMKEDAEATRFFNTLPPGHRRYFNVWIESAKTDQTRTGRIAQTLNALSNHQNYGEMLRSLKKNRM
jgi:hypothetical protein